MFEEIEELRIKVIRAVDEVFQNFTKNVVLIKLDEALLEKETKEIAELLYDILDKIAQGKVKEVWYK